MNPSGGKKLHDPQLRETAEAQLGNAPKIDASAQSNEELLHELHVHQIQLEMQNEALRSANIALEQARDSYVELYDFAPVGYLTLNDRGLIVGINLACSALLGMERGKLLQHRFARFVKHEDADCWHLHFANVVKQDQKKVCELALQKRDGSHIYVRLDSLRIVKHGQPTTVRIGLTDITESKVKEAELDKYREHLEELVRARTSQMLALTSKLVMAEEWERREVAQDLHDDLCQVLATIKLKFALLKAPCDDERRVNLQRKIQEMDELVDNANRSARSISIQLSPPVLSKFGLHPALEWLAEELQNTHGLQISVHCDDILPPLQEAVSITLFRVVRELLLNVSKYACVGEAEVSITTENDKLVITVADNGIGFIENDIPPPSVKGGYGLFSANERMRFLEGDMLIDSSLGKGTLVVLTVPLKAGTGKIFDHARFIAEHDSQLAENDQGDGTADVPSLRGASQTQCVPCGLGTSAQGGCPP